MLNRRLFLRGAAGAVIALPFFEELAPRSALAAGTASPARVVTLFFGLGLDPEWQAERFSGPLQPLAGLADKLTCFTNVNMAQGASGGAHCETSAVVFVGEKQSDVNRAGGASVDQIIRQALAPSAPTLASGLWWRRGACDAQALRVWNADGTPRAPIKRPSQVFDTLFGGATTAEPPSSDPAAVRARHLKRSVLDTVIDQYQRYTGPSSPLGSASKQKLDLHLQSIREIETELAPSDEIIDGGGSCPTPTRPEDPAIADYDRFTYGTGSGAPQITWQDFQKVFRLHADLWVTALRCDAVRYGNLMFESAGGHTNFSGTYAALGGSTSFPGDSQHDSYFHAGKRADARLYQHLAMTNLAYFLERLNDSAYLEADGGTLLDNTAVVIGTEYGWNHSKQNVFHAIAGGRGRFRPGFYDQALNCIDVYNLVLRAHDLEPSIGRKTGVESQGDASDALI